MTPAQWWLGVSVQCAVLFTLAGLIFRDEVRRHWTVALYLLSVMTCGSLILSRPETFFRFHFFVFKEGLYSVAKVAVAAQLAYEVFAKFHGAKRASKRALIGLLTLGALFVGLSPTPHGNVYYPEWHAQVLAATTCLMAGTALVAWVYLVPMGSLHRAVLTGFALYLLTFTTVVNLLTHYGVSRYGLLGLLDGLAYLSMVLWWGITVWRGDEPARLEAAA